MPEEKTVSVLQMNPESLLVVKKRDEFMAVVRYDEGSRERVFYKVEKMGEEELLSLFN